MKILARACALLCLSGLGVPLPAQSTAAPAGDPAASAQRMNDALKLRSDAAAAVAKGDETPAAALGRLRADFSPSGLKIDADADFAFAAIDVGQRLIAAGKPAEAEEFFREAEQALDQVLKKTPDTAAGEKVQYLASRALIRARYLNNAGQAKADLDAAQKLRPDDKYLESLRNTLSGEHGETFKEQPGKG